MLWQTQCAAAERRQADENARLKGTVQRISRQLSDLRAKSRRFEALETSKFDQVPLLQVSSTDNISYKLRVGEGSADRADDSQRFPAVNFQAPGALALVTYHQRPLAAHAVATYGHLARWLQVWAMKRDDLGAAVNRLLAADRHIQERCLGAGDWEPPSAAAAVADALSVAEPGSVAPLRYQDADAADAASAACGSANELEHVSSADSSEANAGVDAGKSAEGEAAVRDAAKRSSSARPGRALWRQLGDVIDGRRYAQWRAAEKELQEYFALLQARAEAARRKKQLREEQEQLQERVEQLRSDPVNQHLQLPPSLFLMDRLSDGSRMRAVASA